MIRRIEIPVLWDKIKFIAAVHDLGDSSSAICETIRYPRRNFEEGIRGDKYGHVGFTRKQLSKLATMLGFDRKWVEFHDPEKRGRDTLEAFKTRYRNDGSTPPCLTAPPSSPASPQSTSLTSRRPTTVQAINPMLASVTLWTGQNDAAKLGVEVTGQPSVISILDERLRPLLQLEVVLLRCHLELRLDGAEVVGGTAALQNVITAYLNREDAPQVIITVGGSAVSPCFSLQARSGALGIIRPMIKTNNSICDDPEDEHGHLCLLKGLNNGKRVNACLRIYSKDLSADNRESPPSRLPNDDEMQPAPVGRVDGAPLTVDARKLIMKRLWELSVDAEWARADSAPGTIILALDLREYQDSE